MSGSDLFTGTLDILILRTLAGGSQHGYAIGRSIRESSAGVLDVEEGALYPALHRLAKRGMLSSKWDRSETGRRAKFYSITATGREHLASEATRWKAFSGAVTRVLEEGGGG